MVLKTEGTQNNHIGLPLTLLQLTEAHQYAVVELGSNHPGEIAYLARIAQPTVAVVTNIGPAHVEFFGTIEAIRQEKLSLLDALGAEGAAVVPGDQLEVLLEAKTRLHPQARLMTFGTAEHCGLQGVEIRRVGMGFALQLRDVPGVIQVPLPGFHNVENVLTALAVVQVLGQSLAEAGEALQRLAAVPMRSELIQCNGFTVLNDCYNANPLSFARALEALHDLPGKRRVVIAGDMMELGLATAAAHQAIGSLAARYGIELVVAVGAYASDVVRGVAASQGTQTLTYRTVEELLAQLPTMVRDGDSLLVKGSRKMRLEQVTAQLQVLGAARHVHGA
jgi:UDP-N-acetylmuramoyl-tripeptide--D-alanyl-D-alanine ligase